MNNIRYSFIKSRDGETVPAIVLPSGESFPLHSTVDPKREARRLVSTIPEDTGFIVFLGLGGGFAAREALRGSQARVIAIDYDNDSISALLSEIDYSALLNDKNFSLLVDFSAEKIGEFILENYRPALCGGIKIIPLRARTGHDAQKFGEAAAAIELAIENVSRDFSVQAHFGRRWFSNIIRNIKSIDARTENLNALCDTYEKHPVGEAAVIAAGPSLDSQIPLLKKFKSNGGFIISSDTALPVLLFNKIKPDIAVSIDCQHISYFHFSGCNGTQTPLVLDIASPPLLKRFSASAFFFSSGHPFSLYISRHWQSFPVLDTSGGNVTYACLSLAEKLEVKRITLFGADFSYVRSSAYARGTYIYPFFEKKQNRLSPMEALFSTFLFRSPFLPKEKNIDQAYHETASLRFYRKKLEEKAAFMTAEILSVHGQGAPVNLIKDQNGKPRFDSPVESQRSDISHQRSINNEQAAKSGTEFLEQYCRDIAALPAADSSSAGNNYIDMLCAKDREIFAALLPLAAWIKNRKAGLKTRELIEETKNFGIKEIKRALAK